jgi:transposase
MGKQCELSLQQRREIVLMMLRREEPVAVLARRHSVSEGTLHRWREEFLQGGEAALADRRSKADAQGAAKVQELQKQLAERDRVIGELTIANRILKKTADGLL